MVILLPILMACLITGRTLHEYFGVAMILAFVVHTKFNLPWYKGLFKGRYTYVRIFQTIINLMLLICMLVLFFSALVISREVFAFLTLFFSTSVGRNLHMLGSYWCFLLMSLHLGLHGDQIIKVFKKKLPKQLFLLLNILVKLVALWGVYAFVKYNLSDYLLLRTMYSFLDPNNPALLFFLEYSAMIILFATIAFYLKRGLQKLDKRKGQAKKMKKGTKI